MCNSLNTNKFNPNSFRNDLRSFFFASIRIIRRPEGYFAG